MKYYELENDRFFEGRWHLRELLDDTDTELDSREFTYGNRMDLGPPLKCSLWNEYAIVDVKPPLKLTLSREGSPLDFTYADEGAPVVTRAIAQLLSELADNDIQRISVKVDGMKEEHEIINVISLVDCLDAKRSEIQWFEEGNDVRPDLAGTPEMVRKIIVDPTRISNHQMFRIKDWNIALIVSETVKNALEEAKVTGVLFREV